MKEMEITAATPERTIYCGNAKEIFVRTTCGDVKILPGHADFMAEIGCGQLHILSEGKTITASTSSGILYTRKNRVSMLLFEQYEVHSRG